MTGVPVGSRCRCRNGSGKLWEWFQPRKVGKTSAFVGQNLNLNLKLPFSSFGQLRVVHKMPPKSEMKPEFIFEASEKINPPHLILSHETGPFVWLTKKSKLARYHGCHTQCRPSFHCVWLDFFLKSVGLMFGQAVNL